MGQNFRKLVEKLMPKEEREAGGRLFICVDDIDRCLPSRQVALLEALRFLSSSGARATFIIAMDPALVSEALKTHYHSSTFDAERYLDKMFHVAVPLLTPKTTEAEKYLGTTMPELFEMLGVKYGMLQLMERATKEDLQQSGAIENLYYRDVLQVRVRCIKNQSDSEAYVIAICRKAFERCRLSNPRLIKRIITKLAFCELPEKDKNFFSSMTANRIYCMFFWIAIIEKWPEIRKALYVDMNSELTLRVNTIVGYYCSDEDRKNKAGLYGLPLEEENPFLPYIFKNFFQKEEKKQNPNEQHIPLIGPCAADVVATIQALDAIGYL